MPSASDLAKRGTGRECARGVAEVWFWQDNRIAFYHLVAGKYVEVATSVSLSDLTSNDLANFANRGLAESPLTIKSDFLEYLQ